MYSFRRPRQIPWLAVESGVWRSALILLLIRLGFLLMAPSIAYGQLYPPLPVPSKYRGPSGEAGQVLLSGRVSKVTLFHGSLADEADWHVHLDLDPVVRADFRSHLSSNGYGFITGEPCTSADKCNLAGIYSEVMVSDDHRYTLSDDKFFSADFTSAFLLTQPPPRIWGPDLWTGEHPAWDLGLIAMRDQGATQDLSEYSQLDGGRAYLQGAFVEDAVHRVCKGMPDPMGCPYAAVGRVAKTFIEVHPLDSIAFAMDEACSVISVTSKEPDWPVRYVRWRVAVFGNSKIHRINGEPYVARERTTTWYLDLPSAATSYPAPTSLAVNVEELPQRLWDGRSKTWYFGRGVKSFPRAEMVIDGRPQRRRLKVTATMNTPNNRGGIVVRDYAIFVNDDLGSMIKRSYLATFGRESLESELASWIEGARARCIGYTQIVSEHVDHMLGPTGAEELRGMVSRSYQQAFGREPGTPERASWVDAVRTRRIGYDDIVSDHIDYLLSPGGAGELRETIRRSYRRALGRDPSAPELDAWVAGATTRRLGYAQLGSEHIDYALSASGAQELGGMITRSYLEVFNRDPTPDELALWVDAVRALRYQYWQLIEAHNKYKAEH